jgi:hypothetical protein
MEVDRESIDDESGDCVFSFWAQGMSLVDLTPTPIG